MSSQTAAVCSNLSDCKTCSIDTRTSESWDLLEQHFLRDAWNSDIGRIRTRRAFRGVQKADYPLLTTLQRLTRGNETRKREQFIFRQFQKYAYQELPQQSNEWHRLSIAQHHGLPTRFLDWTNSPLVALHFATLDPASDDDAAIWSVNFEAVNELTNNSLAPEAGFRSLGRVPTVDELAGSFENLDAFDRKLKARDGSPLMLFFEPPAIDQRIVNQYALFSVLSSADQSACEWLSVRAGAHCEKLIIPARRKPEIRDRLDMMNITERFLITGLDGLALWLKRYFGETPWKQDEIDRWKDEALKW